MKTSLAFKHEFVDAIPERLADRTLYISIFYATAAHKCACGCGSEIVTPISPTDWKLIFDGQSVSLHPSIGNWSLPCRAHYFIKNGQIIWAESWSQTRVEAARKYDLKVKDNHKSDTTNELSSEQNWLMRLLKKLTN